MEHLKKTPIFMQMLSVLCREPISKNYLQLGLKCVYRLITVAPIRTKYLGEIGDVVIGRVMEVQNNSSCLNYRLLIGDGMSTLSLTTMRF